MKTENSNIRVLKLCNSFSRSYFPLAILSSFFNQINPYYNIYLSAEIVNEISGNRNIKTLSILVSVTVVGNLLISIIGVLISKCLSESEMILSQSESRYYIQKLMHMDYSDFENPDIRQLRRKITEVAKINCYGRQLLLKSVSRIINAIVSTIIIMCLSVELFIKSLHSVSWKVTLSYCVIIIFLMTANIAYQIKMKDKNAEAANTVSNTMINNNRVDNAIESYNIGKDIRLYRLDRIIMRLKNERLASHREAFERYSMYQFRSGIPLYVLTTLLNITIYIYIVYNSLLGTFGIGSIIKYVGLSQKMIECVLEIFRGFTDIKTNTRYVEDYLAYFDIPQTMFVGTKSVCNHVNDETIIEFRNVSFKYPSSDRFVLKNINVKISRGERFGIVGQNGSGKTTFIKLLCRLYDPTNGEILFNGINIREYDYQEYISMLSVVFQDFRLFSFRLGQIISGSEYYDSLRVEECLRKVGFGERLDKMENGIESCLYKDFDQNGVEISGGEAQKIALARALYKDAPIIILDEPTSALDPISEAEIYLKFNEIVDKKTAVYISHRLSSCKYCDKIAVLDQGEIVQYGSHQVLVTIASGKYAELWNLQAQYYDE